MIDSSYKGIKYRWLFLIIIGIGFLFTYTYTFDSKLALLGDNASYYTLGKALAQGEGYVNISKISKSPNNHYPPGYPVIISAVLIFSDSIVAVKLLNGLFFLGSLLLVFILISKLTKNYITAFVVSMLAVFNSHLLFYSSLMMSEIPYMFFSLLAIYLFTKIEFESAFWKDKFFIGTVLSMIIAYYIRSLGVALLAGFCLHLLLQKKWKAMGAFILTFIIGFLPWFIRGQKLGGTSYINQLKMINPYNPGLGQANFGDFVDRTINNFSRYFSREIPDAIFTFGPAYNEPIKGSEWFFGFIILALIGYGIYQLKEYRLVILGYLLGTFGILMIWPDVWIGVRFIVPIISILVVALICGFVALLGKITTHSVTQYIPIVAILFTIGSVIDLHNTAKAPYPPAWQRYFEVAEWLKKNEKEVVVSCGKPSLFYTYADNYTMRYKFTQDAEKLIDNLEKQQVDYVVIDQVYGNTFQYLLPAVRQYPDRFQQVLHLKNPDTYLLKFKK
jgi:hypothetical protein